MKSSIGCKIKELRKELKLTQSDLAGNEMTKSMLSQIENGVATPSMKNLTFIANRLGKPIAYFLEDEEIGKRENDELPMEEIDKTIAYIKTLDDSRDSIIVKEKIKELLNKYNFNKNSKLYADILSIYCEPLITLHEIQEAEKTLNECISIYIKLEMYIDAAKVYQNKSLIASTNNEYEKALELLDEAYRIYSKSITKDPIFETENIYWKIATLYSLGEFDEMMILTDRALKISNQTGTYYRTYEFYRIKALCYLNHENYEEFKTNIEKAKQFAELTNDKWGQVSIELNLAKYENDINNPEAGLKHMERYHELIGRDEKSNWYKHEASRSLYMLERYEEAYNLITQYDYSVNRYSKIDYLSTWLTKVYEGLILIKLGRIEEAVDDIKLAIDKISIYSNSKQLSFAYQSLAEAYAVSENYKEAYNAEKKSKEIKDSLLRNGKIYVY